MNPIEISPPESLPRTGPEGLSGKPSLIKDKMDVGLPRNSDSNSQSALGTSNGALYTRSIDAFRPPFWKSKALTNEREDCHSVEETQKHLDLVFIRPASLHCI